MVRREPALPDRSPEPLPVVRPAFRQKPLRTNPDAPVPDHWQNAGEPGTSEDPAFGPL